MVKSKDGFAVRYIIPHSTNNAKLRVDFLFYSAGANE